MNPKALQNNEELFDYLVHLGKTLRDWQHVELAEIVNQASRFASGSTSEFMHEAQLALQRVVKDHPKELSSGDFEDLEAVVAQIKDAFRRIGGA